LIGIKLLENGIKALAITACKRHSLAAGATQGNIAYTQNVSGKNIKPSEHDKI